MRKINTLKKIILIALASLSIISCRKDDDEKEESLILGTWNLTKIQTISGKDNSIISSHIISDCPDKRKYEFFENQYKITYFKDSFSVNCDVNEVENGEFTYNKSQKYILFKPTYSQDAYAINVDAISSNELQISESYFSYDANGDGIDDKEIRVFNK